jgi:RecA-family ATPase
MLLGEPNSGKSMIAQSIASAVVRQDEVLWQTYLVKPGTAKVIYVDEENPTDVVYRRLKSFGVQGYEDRIRYLFHQGVRLDRNADALYDEVAAFRPDLLVLDSLVRLHSKDENSSSDMAVLYNDAIKPIARELGTTVLLLHHSSKTDSTSSYKRGRGSGELTASPDVGLDIRVLGDNRFNLVTYKTRRAAKAGGTAFAIVEDNHGLRIKPDDYNPDF